MWVGVQRHPRPLYPPPKKKLGTHFKAGLVGQGPVWTGAENPHPCRDVCVIISLNFLLHFTVINNFVK